MSNARQGSAQGAQAPQQGQPSAPSTPMKPVGAKLCMLGTAAAGKSSLCTRFVANEFHENKEPTIGAAFLTQKCRLDSAIIKFEIWDTAGQERFHSLAPMYYRNAQASAVVYDVTSASSFESAKSWVKELQRQASPNIVIALVGNKVDLVSKDTTAKSASEQEDQDDEDNDESEAVTEDGTTAGASGSPSSARAVPFDEAKAYADEGNMIFIETSAKTGEGVMELFTEIAKRIPVEQLAAAQQQRSGAAGAGASGGARGQQGAGGRGGGISLTSGGAGASREACNC